MSKPFKLQEPGWDKELKITGPDDLSIEIDYDDVDHQTVMRNAKKLVRLLNKHWES